jgi:hypothetical protein
MKGLITDRTLRNVYYRKELSNKGFAGMTQKEKTDWLGDPFATVGVNLFACGPYYSDIVELKYRSEEIVATTATDGIYLFAPSIIGEATDFENRVLTLSATAITASGNGTPQIAMYWHDETGYDFAGGALLTAGSVTFDTSVTPNTNKRKHLAAYVYVTTHETVTGGATARFENVMLELGDTRHPYVPYTEILATDATKGAYNYSDLNRVERAVAEISDALGLGLITRTNWGMWDIPTVSEMGRYLSNIAKIRSVLPTDSMVPEAPTSMDHMTHVEANNIELILDAVYESIKK